VGRSRRPDVNNKQCESPSPPACRDLDSKRSDPPPRYIPGRLRIMAQPMGTTMRHKLADNLKRFRDRIHGACARSGRRVEDVKVVAVTKTVEADVIRAAIETGLTDLGESRVQDLIKRASMVHEHLSRRRKIEPADTPPEPRWHMAGHLQRNKVRLLLPWVHTVHSLDSLRLAEEIGAEATRIGKTVPALVQVNVASEKSKHGIAVGATSHFAENISNMPGLSVVGLMTMAPLEADPESTRPHFSRLREVLEDMRTEGQLGPDFQQLSMGMSHDFEVAVEEGATMIRVGTALFDGVV